MACWYFMRIFSFSIRSRNGLKGVFSLQIFRFSKHKRGVGGDKF